MAETPAAPATKNRILTKMLERLFATLVNGPSMNCRPHSSRQRVDLFSLSRLKDLSPDTALMRLLGEERQMKCAARVPAPPKRAMEEDDAERPALSEADRAAVTAWREQEALFAKLRTIAEDARTYEQDTGVHVLNVGFPLLSLPPNSFAGKQGGLTRRIVAPIAFIPVSIIVKQGATRSVELKCVGEGTDRVVPNTALLAWLEQQTGKAADELFADERGEDPWREVRELVAHVAKVIEIPAAEVPGMIDEGDMGVSPTSPGDKNRGETPVPPEAGSGRQTDSEGAQSKADSAEGDRSPEQGDGSPRGLYKLQAAPRSDESSERAAILPCAILGLFPLANQGLLRDMQAMLAGEALDGPVASFIKLSQMLDATPPSAESEVVIPARGRTFAEERLIAEADPCQSRAVRLARECPTLVIHGPPGTGKSQTITNIIGDHLARGERVLVVSDKRTALDVVANRLRHLGLGALLGIVHDPQRDQRDLYKALRQQLDDLPEAGTHPQAARQLETTDTELQRLHGEVTQYAAGLTTRAANGYSFHDLVGEWFEINPGPGLTIDEAALKETPLEALDAHTRDIQDILERAWAVDLPNNPWRSCAGIELAAFLARPMETFRAAMARCTVDAAATDATADAGIPPFAVDLPLETQAAAREGLAGDLETLLAAADPAVLARWADRDVDAIRAAKAKLDEAGPQIAVFRGGPLDAELLARTRQRSASQGGEDLRSHLPSRAETASQWRALRTYSEAYRDGSGRLMAIRAIVPSAKLGTIIHWLSRDPQALRLGQKVLDAMKPLAEAIAAAPLDLQLERQCSATPLDVPKINGWLSALGEYLQVAPKWYAFLKPGVKGAARPIAQFFGLPLDPPNAERLRTFLTAFRSRADLKAGLDQKILPAPMPDGPSDDELLRVYEEHAMVAHATAMAEPRPSPNAEVPVEAVHALMRQEADAATLILKAWNLDLTPATADRLATFLGRLNARLQLSELHHTVLSGAPQTDLPDDSALERSVASHAAMFEFALKLSADPTLKSLHDAIELALREPATAVTLIDGLRKSPARAAAIGTLEKSLASSALFSATWLESIDHQLREGKAIRPAITALAEHLVDLESILRIAVELNALSPALRSAVESLVSQTAGVKEGFDLLRKGVLGSEILRRLAADPNLQGIDGQRMRTSFDRYRTLDQQKKEYVRRTILHRWISVQKSRLLANTGSRLNSLGAELKRRLTLRGERAMRLRQVIQVGQQTEGGDPLFDLCPVWMASPETVAQLFPRRPLFDAVIFDEASQCRLEEALPVLTRASRVVIAGDPKQLPPTRFFESAVARSEDEEIETDQQLFESQQGEIEDLLAAALNLDIQECYLDVHYRSRNSDLIQFSNANFYGSRLQAIPGHPKNRTRYAPLTLYRADGTYEKRSNKAEADRVCAIVRDLLKRADPPSIGIGCFNLPQRDLIVDTLDEMAEQDGDFAKRLDAARRREGTGSFEGLFVKNLENVQGDERDHLIISTTYGPDASGKFHRRFGPVGNVGGGRRLNVLVTRAREEVHLVTSIPAQAYRTLPPIPAGETPSGAYLLFAYLQYAERLATRYELAHVALEAAPADATARVDVRPTRTPSRFATALAGRLAEEQRIGSIVHWGNDGFCVDVALHHPTRADEVTLGVLCDTARFTQSADPVEWDIFRTGILEGQGWELHRLWTPHFYRDAEGSVKVILDGAAEAAAKSHDGTGGAGL